MVPGPVAFGWRGFRIDVIIDVSTNRPGSIVIYQELIEETGIHPDKVYAECRTLTAFIYPASTRTTPQAPRPGQKPTKGKRVRR